MNIQKENTLIIPSGLSAYKNVKQLFEYDNGATIIYKNLNFDLINIEFYTQTYCIVFNCDGAETMKAMQEVENKETENISLEDHLLEMKQCIKN